MNEREDIINLLLNHCDNKNRIIAEMTSQKAVLEKRIVELDKALTDLKTQIADQATKQIQKQ